MDISRVIWLGLTGGIATGKTTACNYLRQKSIPIIDADAISHDLLLSGGLAVDEIVDKFGDSVLQDDNSISRPKLGEIVFGNRAKLLLLNQIMHPLVRLKSNQLKEKLVESGEKIIVNDVPLLFENSLQNQYDKTILIYCPEQLQVERLKSRNNYSDKEINVRLRSQMSIENKKKIADIVINNTGTTSYLHRQLDQLINGLN